MLFPEILKEIAAIAVLRDQVIVVLPVVDLQKFDDVRMIHFLENSHFHKDLLFVLFE